MKYSPNKLFETSDGLKSVPLEDDFLNQRIIFINDTINPETANCIIKQLLYLNSTNPDGEITVYINSPGGSVNDGLAIYDTMRLLRTPLRAIVTGLAASMGAVIYLAADTRQMLPHSQIMIHDPAFGGCHDISGKKPHEIQSELDSLNKCRKRLTEIIAERTGKPFDEICNVTQQDTFFDAEESVAFGLAHEIINKI
jgi:ATP-dependent Clp protease protease subunit